MTLWQIKLYIYAISKCHLQEFKWKCFILLIKLLMVNINFELNILLKILNKLWARNEYNFNIPKCLQLMGIAVINLPFFYRINRHFLYNSLTKWIVKYNLHLRKTKLSRKCWNCWHMYFTFVHISKDSNNSFTFNYENF